jgi:hypothetical protein
MGNIRKIESLRSLAGLFSASLIAKSVAAPSPAIVERRIRKHITNIPASQGSRYADFFGLLYQELSSLYANEYIFKNTIINTVRKDKKYRDSIILDEFTIGKSIADVVIINGDAEIYEIKTNLDNPDRLLEQLNSYYKAVTLVNVVIHKNEQNKYLKYLNTTPCGILVFSLDHGLERIRQPEKFSSSLDHSTIFKLLRKGEYLKIIKDLYNYVPEVPNTEIFQHCLSQIKEIEVSDFQKLSFQVLKMRKKNIEDFFNAITVPDEFAYVLYQLNISKTFYLKFDKFINQTIN